MSDKREEKRRRRAKRLAKRAAGKTVKRRPVLARCGGGAPWTREQYLATAASDPDDAGVWNYLADPGGVVIEGARVVNRLPRPVEVSITVEMDFGEAGGRPGKPDLKVETLDRVKIAAEGFIDFGAHDAGSLTVRPLFVLSALAKPADVMNRLQDGDYCVPEPPADLGPWRATGIPGVSISDHHIHNAGRKAARFLAVCAGENEAGDKRCAVFRGVIAGRNLGDVRHMANGATAELLVNDADLAAEAASSQTAFDADVATGRMTAEEAADLLAMDDGADRWIDPDWIELVAVVPPKTQRRALRELYDQWATRHAAA